MKFKSISIALIIVLILATAAGCSSKTNSNTPASNDKVLYHAFLSTPYVTLDPGYENSNGGMVLSNVYETLTHYNDATKKVEPLIATSWTSNADGTQWVFELRNDVVFHDGTKLTAANVVASVNEAIKKGGGAAYIWDSVDTVKATGDYEVTFNLKYATQLDQVASSGYSAFIMSDNAIGKSTDWFNAGNDGGSGPYMITKATGDSVVLKAFEDYRGGWKPDQYKNIIIKEVAESSARRQLIESGEAQIASDFSSTDLAALKKETDKVDIYQATTFNNVMILINTQAKYTSNVDFRRALSYAFPYKDVVDNVLEGDGTQARGQLPKGMFGYSDKLFQYSFDMTKAKEYLDKSGIDPKGVKLVLTYTTGFDAYNSWAQMYQANLKELGITLDIRAMEWDNQWNMAKATKPNDRQDMFCMMWWPEYSNSSSWFDSMVRNQKEITFNLTYMNDPKLEAQITEAEQAQFKDPAKAEQLYFDIQKKLIDNADFIFLYDLDRVYAVSKTIAGVHENPGYPYSIDYYKVTSAQ